MLKKNFITVFAVSSMLAVNAFAEVYEHKLGTVEFEQPPERIILFDMAPLDTLDALGVEVIGLTQPHAAGYLADFKSDEYINVGTMFEPDFEGTAAAEPDLIIVGARAARHYDMFSSITQTLDTTVWGENFLDQFYGVTEMLASVVGKEQEAADRLNAIKQSVEEINALAPNAGNALVILTTGGKITAYGTGSRFGWLHEDLGIIPAVEDVEDATHGEPISFEFLAEVNPDWLFVLDRDAAIGQGTGAAEALLDNDLVKNMSAFQNDQVVYMDGMAWYIVGGGMQAIEIAIGQVKEALTQ